MRLMHTRTGPRKPPDQVLRTIYLQTFLPVRLNRSLLNACRRKGGTNPKIVLSTGEHGYFAIAVSNKEKGNIVGWSGSLQSPDAATKEAIANCEKRGGTDPRIEAQWRDYFHAGEKRSIPAP